jgi:hypothetical protein
VFDFDGGVFAALWATKTPTQFRSFIRYYLSDHRPLLGGVRFVSVAVALWATRALRTAKRLQYLRLVETI